MENALTILDVAIRLGAASLCGLIIGLDRELKHKNVGLRTFLLVCLGAAGFSILIIEIAHFYMAQYKDINVDPTRIVVGIITGIGFLGGGAILQASGQIRGAATGASIWLCGAIGVACGFGYYWIAAIITAYAFIVLAIVGFIRAEVRDDLDKDDGEVSNNDPDDISDDDEKSENKA